MALGFFDGVHRGHQDLVRTLVYACQVRNLVPAVFTFPQHPSATLDPESRFAGYLTTLDQRLALLDAAGVAEAHLQPFTAEFAALPPLEFLDTVVRERLQAKLVVVGSDYRFGLRGHGNLHGLQHWASQHGIEVIAVPDVILYGRKVSSSRIRSLIAQGDAGLAGNCLGRPYEITGTVVRGRGLGRKFDFPTANIAIPADVVLPAFGVYATRTRVNGRTYESITNVGVRPTVNDILPKPNVESYLYDAQLNLYGQTIKVEFLQRIRPEDKFESLLQMVAQIKQDLDAVREWHRSSEQGYEAARIHGIPVRVLRTRRFAQASLFLVFQVPLTRRNASRYTLLLRLLAASCRRYPTRAGLAAALDSLYGASIDSDVDKQGDILSVYLTADGLMHWTDGSSPFQAAVSLLFSALREPNTDADGLLDAQQFEAERLAMIMELQARENDKSKYAYDRCIQLLCGDQPAGLWAGGDAETLGALTREDLQTAYQELLQDASLAVYVGGDLTADLLEQLFQEVSRLPAGNRPALPPRPGAFLPASPADQIEEKDVEQARICLAYKGLPPYFSHQTVVSTVLNSMLGGDVHSLLFDVVREQLGLAYSVYSLNAHYMGSLLLIAGVAPDQVEAARQAMVRQVEALAAGDFSDRLLERARSMVESTIRSVSDDLDSMLAHQLASAVHSRQLAMSDSLSLLQDVSRQRIQDLARQLSHQTCYVLTRADQAAADLSDPGPAAAATRASNIQEVDHA